MNSGVLVPQIITQDLFPNIYALDVPDAIFDDTYDMYHFGLPSVLTESIDAAFVTGPQKYEYKYTNANGIDVVVRGTYNDVMSTIDVLNTYHPIKKDCTKSQTGNREYFELYGPGSQPTNVPNVPIVGTVNNGKHIYLKMDGKTFSGSGSLIMVFETGKPTTDAKILLFRGKNNYFQDLGGRIDKPLPNVVVDVNTLFNNAKKETEEESMKLFTLTKPSNIFVDIESTTDNTFYRVYLYLFSMDNIKLLTNMYKDNKIQIINNFPHNFDESYKETDMLALFDYNMFINKLATYNSTVFNTSSGSFQTIDGSNVNVRGRTMKVIAKLQAENKFLNVINNKLVTTSSTTLATRGHLFNTITL